MFGTMQDPFDLLVRPSVKKLYDECFASVCQDWKHRRKTHLFLGNPGIGKSYSMLYLLRLILDNPPSSSSIPDDEIQMRDRGIFSSVVWREGYVGPFHVFCREEEGWSHEQCTSLEFEKVARALKKPTAMLYDVVNHRVEEDCFLRFFDWCVFSSSPDPQQTQYVEKHLSPTFCYVDTWTIEELLAVAPVFKVDETDVRARFSKVGGLPRYVFGAMSVYDKYEGNVNSAIVAFLEEKLFSCSSSIIHRGVKIVTKVFKMVAVDDGKHYTLAPMTDHIESELLRRYHNMLMTSTFQRGSLGGMMFEVLVRNYLSQARDAFPNARAFNWTNSKWTATKLADVPLPPLGIVVKTETSLLRPLELFPQVVAESGEALLVAPAPNYPIVDFVWKNPNSKARSVVAYKSTISDEHSVSSDDVKKLGDLAGVPLVLIAGHKKVTPKKVEDRGGKKLFLIVLSPSAAEGNKLSEAREQPHIFFVWCTFVLFSLSCLVLPPISDFPLRIDGRATRAVCAGAVCAKESCPLKQCLLARAFTTDSRLETCPRLGSLASDAPLSVASSNPLVEQYAVRGGGILGCGVLPFCTAA